ncbi:MAG: pyridoxal phosphate-dependent aminotransferase [Bryobacteraceae bacterium]
MTITHGGDIFSIARARGWDWREVLDFSASINPLGPSPRVRPAIEQALDEIVHYPDRDAARLTSRLAEEWSVRPEQVLLGNGATELIHFLAVHWRHDTVAIAVPTFSEFHRAYPKARCVPWSVPHLWPSEGLLILAQPNNPTGAILDPEFPRRRSGSLLIDESFIDFSEIPSLTGSGCMVLRSLTKFYALPGLRIGALVGPAREIGLLRECRPPWQVNVLAEAVALATLEDAGHARMSRAFIAEERSRLWKELGQLDGIDPLPTHANFYFVRLHYPSAPLCRWMLEHKIILRDCTGWPGVDFSAVRFAIRSHAENSKLLELWKEYPCAA